MYTESGRTHFENMSNLKMEYTFPLLYYSHWLRTTFSCS